VRNRSSRVGLALAAAVVLATTGCGGKDKPDPVKVNQVARYCDLYRQFDELAATTRAATSPSEFDGTKDQIGNLLTQTGPTLDELQDTAPGAVNGDVRTVIGALRKAQSGDRSAIDSPSFRQALTKIGDDRAKNCSVDTGSGER
jgi:hypothetical protein